MFVTDRKFTHYRSLLLYHGEGENKAMDLTPVHSAALLRLWSLSCVSKETTVFYKPSAWTAAAIDKIKASRDRFL